MAFCIHLHTRKTSWKPLAAYYGMTLLLFACFVQVATAPSSVSSPVVDRRSEESATTLGDYSELRRLIWEPALAMWLDHPWWGVGPAHFDYRFREYRAGTIQARPDRVHNDLLNALADWGLAGTGLLLAGIAMGFRSGLRSLRTDATWHLCGVGADRSTGGLVFGLVVGSAVLLMHSLVDFNLHIPGNALLCVTFLAWICNLDPNRNRVRSRRLLLWGSRAAGMVAGAFAVVMVLLLGRWAAEQRWLAGAQQAGASVPEPESALRGAFLVEPGNFETAGRLGEILRLRGWVGGEDYRLLTGEAMLWFERAMELNPHDPHSRLRYGMCLHWLERHEEAGQHFEEGLQLDPHGYYANALMGWHFLQLGDWVESERWFQRSLELLPAPQNAIAPAYLAILQQVRNRPEFTPAR
jgi:hypothetical protein